MLVPYSDGRRRGGAARDRMVAEVQELLQRAGIDDVLPVAVPVEGPPQAILVLTSALTGKSLAVPDVLAVLAKPVPSGEAN
jgi:hypothetical protein